MVRVYIANLKDLVLSMFRAISPAWVEVVTAVVAQGQGVAAVEAEEVQLAHVLV